MIELLKRRIIVITLALVAVALVSLLALRSRNPEQGWLIEEILQAIAYPVQAGFHNVGREISVLTERYIVLVSLKQENEKLRSRVQALQEELNHHINGSIQFNLLREQLRFLEDNPEKKIFAEVIGESVDNFHHILVINKGLMTGIRRNFPVVLREGVVGRIQSATATQAIVELVIDRRHRFPALVQRTRERMVVAGDEDTLRLVSRDRGIVVGLGSELRMNRVRMLADVQRGDRVITSGLAGIFPKGMLVGTISNVYREQHELFQTAEIEPAVDFNKIEWVFVILRKPGTGNYPLFTNP